MKQFLVSVLVPALMLAFATVTPAMKHEAEKGKSVVKALLENDKVRVFENRYKAGDEFTSVPFPTFRVIRALKGGTILRTYADGKTEKVEWKTGEVRMVEPSKIAYTAKNIGKTDITLYVVVLKQPK